MAQARANADAVCTTGAEKWGGAERPHVPPGSRLPGARRLLPENREQEAIDIPSASGFACRACAPNLSAVSRACGIDRRVEA